MQTTQLAAVSVAHCEALSRFRPAETWRAGQQMLLHGIQFQIGLPECQNVNFAQKSADFLPACMHVSLATTAQAVLIFD